MQRARSINESRRHPQQRIVDASSRAVDTGTGDRRSASKPSSLLRTTLSLLLLCLATAPALSQGPSVREVRFANQIQFQADSDSGEWFLVVAGEGRRVMRSFDGTASMLFDVGDPLGDGTEGLADGQYQYELRAVAAEAKGGEDSSLERGALADRVLRGSLVVRSGQIFAGDPAPSEDSSPASQTGEPQGNQPGLHTKSSAILDLGIDNACLGSQCASPISTEPMPSVGDAYLKLRDTDGGGLILIDDASGAIRDWQLAFNDSNSASANSAEYFAVFDLGTSSSAGAAGTDSGQIASIPFLIEGGAPSYSMHVSSFTGYVGMGTSTPVRDLEILSSSPAVRLSDDAGRQWTINNSSSSTDFDIVSTQGGMTPIRHFFIERSAPADQLMLTSGGIGIGTRNPNATVEIFGNSGSSQMAVTEQGADAAVEVMLNLICNCAPAFRMTNTTNGQVWFFRHLSGGDFSFDDPSAAGQEMRLTSTGNLFLKGSLSQGSSRALKENLVLANGESVLTALAGLDLYEWSYVDQDARHFGPMAEDFSAAYGLGSSSAKIAPADMAGLALAGLKALGEKNDALEAEKVELQEINAEQQQTLDALLAANAEQQKLLEALLARVDSLEERARD